MLAQGGNSMEAVETVIRIMEDDSLFNAGRGAVFTAEAFKNSMPPLPMASPAIAAP